MAVGPAGGPSAVAAEGLESELILSKSFNMIIWLMLAQA